MNIEWISVKDKLPEIGSTIICFNGFMHLKTYDDIWYDGDYHWSGLPIGKVEQITHWMPLPKPPKE